MAKAQKITAQFNREVYAFDRAGLVKKISAAVKKNAPRSAENLKHRIYLPGVKVPVSIGYAVLNLLGVEAIGESANGKAKGAYHPAQALSTFAKFAPLGVRVESDGTSPKYVQFSAAARKLAAAPAKKTGKRSTSKGKPAGKGKRSAKK